MTIASTFITGSLALSCAVLGGFLAWHHPLAPATALLVCTCLAALVFMRLAWWPMVVLGLLPLAGLMPWTGWLIVEEFDLVVLSVAAGGYARLAVAPHAGVDQGRRWLPLLIALPYIASTILGLQRGILDAGGMAWGWWQGYVEPLNALRLAKSLFQVLLVVPLWLAARASDQQAAERSIDRGMLILLTGVVAGVLWERVSFTGLLNFSTDYRATGPFWEMHVGGAALDAAVAMGLPFAALALTQARRSLNWALLAVLCAGGLYAALVTFSRIVYAAVPLSLMLAFWFQARARGPTAGAVLRLREVGVLGLAIMVFGMVAIWSFNAGGYRGLFMCWGVAAVGALIAHAPKPARWWMPLSIGLIALLLAWSAFVASGTASRRPSLVLYLPLLCAVGPVAALAALGRLRPLWAWMGLALMVAVWIPALRWDGALGIAGSLAAVLGAWGGTILAASTLPGNTVSEPRKWRSLAQWWAVSLAVSAVVGVFLAGGYMSQRMQEVSQDSVGRIHHWQRAVSLLDGSSDWMLGKGLGRYHAHHGLSGRIEDQSGDYRLIRTDRGQSLVLSSGKHPFGSGGVFRLSQRISLPIELTSTPPAQLQLRLSYRADQTVRIRGEVCEKQLIYSGSCIATAVEAKPGGKEWRQLTLPLKGSRGLDGTSIVRPLVVVSIGIDTEGARVEFDDLSLQGADGRELLLNANFERGLARWFTTSDRDHLPWHAKNLMLHLVFEQGLLGLASFLLILLSVCLRLWRSNSAGNRLAPKLAAALAASLTVGLVDSLFDIPRITFLVLLFLMLALLLPRAVRPAAAATRGQPTRGADRPAKG